MKAKLSIGYPLILAHIFIFEFITWERELSTKRPNESLRVVFRALLEYNIRHSGSRMTMTTLMFRFLEIDKESPCKDSGQPQEQIDEGYVGDIQKMTYGSVNWITMLEFPNPFSAI